MSTNEADTSVNPPGADGTNLSELTSLVGYFKLFTIYKLSLFINYSSINATDYY